MAIASNTIRGVPNSVHHCEVGGENLVQTSSLVLPRTTDARRTATAHTDTAREGGIQTVPDVVGAADLTAVEALTDPENLIVNAGISYHPTAPLDEAIAQNIAPGVKVFAATILNVTFSDGPQP
jgi:hypothetical protein